MLKKRISFYCILVFITFYNHAYGSVFNFSGKEPLWAFYGNGTGIYDPTIGRSPGSVKLSCDWGENETTFFEWKDLRPGHYRISFYVKAEDLQLGPDKVSLWNFYDAGKGTETTIHNLTGSFNWKKIQFSISINQPNMTMWFRLKGPGQVWIDDFILEEVSEKIEKVSIGESEHQDYLQPNKRLEQVRSSTELTPKEVVLYDFNSHQRGHPFSQKTLSAGNNVGKFQPHKFYDFTINELPVRNWSAFDRIEFDIFNPDISLAEVIVTLADEKSRDYWSQTNHKQSLAPGWNKVTFSLAQFVGERGSHRFLRSIDLSKLTKFHLIVDPDKKMKFKSNDFYIDNIKLSHNPFPEIPDKLYAFDFTTHKTNSNTGFQKVSSQTLFNDQRGFGFYNPVFWKIEDSKYTSEILRYSVGLLNGHFKVKLPNGKYRMSLILDKLGYWDVPFWRERNLYVNGKILLKETRLKGEDFVKDFLIFENIEPKESDNPYDLYLSKIFKPYEFTVEVTNGILDLKFEGDASAVALNMLIIWNTKDESKARHFLANLEKRNQQEFSWITRPIRLSQRSRPNQLATVQIVEPDFKLTPTTIKPPISDVLTFKGGSGERPYQVLQLNSGGKNETFSWSMSTLVNEKGNKIPSDIIETQEVTNQFSSPDLNHETYTLTGKILKKIKTQNINLPARNSRFLWMQMRISDILPEGIYKGSMQIKFADKNKIIPVEIHVLSYKLPQVDFPVGFMGLDPLPESYFPEQSYAVLRKKFRKLALNKLADSGFTTFSGLPEVKLKSSKNKLELDFSDLNELFLMSKKLGFGTQVYSYGGSFPQKILDGSNKPLDMDDNAFLLETGKQLKAAFSRKDWPVIVHTFSDEAGGYSDRFSRDIEQAKLLKRYFPYMSLGGFGSFNGKTSEELNKFFEFGFYSGLTKNNINFLKEQKLNWGLYNSSPGNFDDPRNVFGPGLYFARKAGLSHFLEWNSFGFNNYPYYELDGREADVALFYPTTEGTLNPSLRFEFASEGIQFLRKLMLLEKMLESHKAAGKPALPAVKWLQELKQKIVFDSSEKLAAIKSLNFLQINRDLTEHLADLTKTKMTSHFTPKQR